MTTTTMLRAASQVKLATTILVLRLVEQGRLTLETPVGDIVPAFNALQVLDGFAGDQPVLRPPASRATIRHLLTHTSGLGYDVWNRKLSRFYELTGEPKLRTGLRRAFSTAPLVCDPGSAFNYGIGMDWAGLVVEALEQRPLDVCLAEQIFDPVGMDDSFCWLEDNHRERSAKVHVRGEDGGWVATGTDYYDDLSGKPEFYGGGHSFYTTAGDFLRLQQVVLRGGVLHAGDGNLLAPQSIEWLFEDQLHGSDCGILETANEAWSANVDLRGKRWSLGLLLDVEQVEHGRAAGSAGWAGAFNTFYWIDRVNGLAAALYTQTLPFWEKSIVELYGRFEQAVYHARFWDSRSPNRRSL
jgi:CubicO group peptidase (beta-lactamase class C family)